MSQKRKREEDNWIDQISEKLGIDESVLRDDSSNESSDEDISDGEQISDKMGKMTFEQKDESDDDVYISDEYEDAGEGEGDDLFNMLQEQSDDEELAVLNVLDQKDVKLSEEINKAKEQKKLEEKEKTIFEDVEYDDDSEEDENQVNTIGNVPLEWYQEYDHIGYDLSGSKIIRKNARDTLDDLVRRVDEPNKLEIYDEYNDKWVQLSKKDVETILSIQKGQTPAGFGDLHAAPEMEYDSRFPLVGTQEPKMTFLGIDVKEQQKINALVKKIQSGWIPPYRREYKKDSQAYLLWGPDGRLIDDEGIKRTEKLRPPRESLPSHADSYNPSEEYIHDSTQVYDSLRKVPQPSNYIKMRMHRCLDLHLCPRVKGNRRRNENPDDLLPELPDPSKLRPFPEIQSVVYEGHTSHVRSISIDPTGLWLASGDANGTVRLWEAETGRCTRVWSLGNETIRWVEFNPNPQINLLLVATEEFVYVIQPPESGTEQSNKATRALFPVTEYEEDNIIEIAEDDDTAIDPEDVPIEDVERDEDDVQEEETVDGLTRKGRKKMLARWHFFRSSEHKDFRSQGIILKLQHLKYVTQASWHRKGDYFTTLSPEANNDGILIHQLSRRKSTKPFKKRFKHKGQKVTRILFHPSRNLFYLVTPTRIRIFDIVSQRQRKTLRKQKCRYINDIDIHPQGQHLLIGGLDKRLEFFEMEISSKPCKSLRFHKKAVRSVSFHKRYPLFASASDDGYIHIFHCTTYQDWLKDPLIVPVKILKGHRVTNALGVLDIQWHPTQPWIYTCGADYSIRCWTS